MSRAISEEQPQNPRDQSMPNQPEVLQQWSSLNWLPALVHGMTGCSLHCFVTTNVESAKILSVCEGETCDMATAAIYNGSKL